MTLNPGYRADIDGLRAIAVMLVVLYHGELLGISGGFVGVDIFFVISGFLITRQLLAAPQDLLGFYERRARRLLPSLFAMLAVVTPVAWYVLLPHELESFGRSLVATVGFVSNLHFWAETGYFQGPAEAKPLLHTWSLAIEEQFYLLFPALLLLLKRTGTRRLLPWFLGAAALSLALSVWALERHPSANFYLAPTRAWELLLGSALAILPASRAPARIAIPCTITALMVIAACALLYTRGTPFPGSYALPPCLAAALLIRYAPLAPPVRRGLSWSPLVMLGLVSYALYLWHWPVLVLYSQHRGLETTALERTALLLLSALAAWLSWRWLEQPIRARRKLAQRSALATTGIAAGLALTACGALLWSGKAPLRPLAPIVDEVLAVADEYRGHFLRCTGNIDLTSTDCRFGAPVTAGYLLWGDSHALALAPGLGRAAEQVGAAVAYAGKQGCAPLPAVAGSAMADNCGALNGQVLEALPRSAIHTVILAARWVALVEGLSRVPGPAEYDEPPLLSRYLSHPIADAETPGALSSLLQRTISTLQARGYRVAVVYPIPEAGYPVPETLARILRAEQAPERFLRPRSLFDARNQRTFEALDGLKPPLARLYPHMVLCDATACRVQDQGQPLYLDDDHLSRRGAELLAPMLESLFETASKHAKN